MPQKSGHQLELPFGSSGEAAKTGASAEASPAKRGNERPGASGLMEAVCERRNLLAALQRVRDNGGSPGIDGVTVEDLPALLRAEWPRIREELFAGCFQPQPVRRVMIPKPGGGERELGIPTVLDRFIQQAMLQVLQPRFDPTFSDHSYGFRPNRRAHDAVRRAQRYVQEGRCWVVDIDLDKFFDRVNRDILMGRLAKRIKDRRVLGLIRRYLEAGILANGVVMERDEGVPQGSPLSPLLANVLLDEVDRELEKRGHAFVRSAYPLRSSTPCLLWWGPALASDQAAAGHVGRWPGGAETPPPWRTTRQAARRWGWVYFRAPAASQTPRPRPQHVGLTLSQVDTHFVRYADDLNVYVRTQRSGERVMQSMRRLYAGLRLRINESKSAVALARERKFLGFSFWNGPDREIKRRVAPQALKRMKEHVRELTRRTIGRSLAAVCRELRAYLLGWRGYFRFAQTPKIFATLDKWIRHRLRALQLKQWKHGRVIYRELRARGLSERAAARVAANGRRWWHNSAMDIHVALPKALFDELGVPRLAA